MRRQWMWLAVLTVGLACAAPTLAEKGTNKFRFGIQYVSPTGDYTETVPGEIFTIEADDALGFFAEYERMLADKAGLFVNLSYQSHDVDASVQIPGFSDSATIGDVDATPFELGFNYYVVQNDSVDFYLGAKAAYIMFSDVNLDANVVDPGDPTSIATDDSTGFGLQLGVDLPFGSGNWMFSSSLQYLAFDLETDEPGAESIKVGVDPFVLKVGIGTRF